MRRINVRRGLADEAGGALVEFAFVLPFLLLIVWGIIDFGRLFFTSNSLATSVREGARFAAVLAKPKDNKPAIKAKVVQSFSKMWGPALDTAKIDVVDNSTVDGTVTVRINDYPAPVFTPIRKVIGGSTFKMTRQATFRWEQAVP